MNTNEIYSITFDIHEDDANTAKLIVTKSDGKDGGFSMRTIKGKKAKRLYKKLMTVMSEALDPQ